ncbi:hypothetical protein IWZ00DRAFT_520527, partial [Phyllosticta capitalensis]
MKAQLEGITSERDDLKARIEERHRQLGEKEKAFKDIESAKKKIEAEAAGKDRAISAQKESISKLEKQLGEVKKEGNVASMLEQSCQPLKSGIEGIRSQLEVLLNDKKSNKDTAEILTNVRQIQVSSASLACDFTRTYQSADQFASRYESQPFFKWVKADCDRINSTIRASGKEARGSTEAIASLKEFFSTEIGATRQEISSQQELQEQCSGLRQENVGLTERNSRLQERVADIERQLEASSNGEEALQQNVKELKDEVAREKAAAAMSRDERQRLRELEAGNGRLTSELEQSRSELQLKRDELEAKCKFEKDLQAKIAALQNDGATSGNERSEKEVRGFV